MQIVADPVPALLKSLPLEALHREAGAVFTAFANTAMPVQYRLGIVREHQHCRSLAGLFDISHMGQIAIRGDHAARALESLMPVDLEGLPVGRQCYALLTNDAGGIIDDVIIAHLEPDWIVIANAARIDAVLAHMSMKLAGLCTVRILDDLVLLALQGPAAATVLARLTPALATLPFQAVVNGEIETFPCRVSRSGYTGEDGYEIAVPTQPAGQLARKLLAQPEVSFIGLGARDTLRLEAGLCLYGHDIDMTTTPVTAGLAWTIARARRAGGARAGAYPGAAIVEQELKTGAAQIRVGLLPEGRAPLRADVELRNAEDAVIGRITSGGFSPTLQCPIAMGYLARHHAAAATAVYAWLRGQRVRLKQTALPFIPHRYYRLSASSGGNTHGGA